MARPQKEPLRPLTAEEREILEQVARAKALLAVSDGQTYGKAAQAAGRRSGKAVSQLVRHFNQESLAAIEPRHGGGPQPIYGVAEQERILAEARRKPDREQDGTATWSLSTLQQALRQTPDGLSRSVLLQFGWPYVKPIGHGNWIAPGVKPAR